MAETVREVMVADSVLTDAGVRPGAADRIVMANVPLAPDPTRLPPHPESVPEPESEPEPDREPEPARPEPEPV